MTKNTPSSTTTTKNMLSNCLFPSTNSNSPSSFLGNLSVLGGNRRGAGEFVEQSSYRREYIHRKREHNCRILFRTDLDQCLQITQLDGDGLVGHSLRGARQVLRGGSFTFRMNDFGAALALGFGLAGDGADHLIGEIHLFHLDHRDLHAPGSGVLIERALKLHVELLALAEELIELHFSEHAAQRGLGQLRGGIKIIRDLNDGFGRIDDAEINHRVYFDRDIIAGHDVLRRNFHGFDAQGYTRHAIDGDEHQNHARTLGLGAHAAQAENDGALVLRQNFDARDHVDHDHDDENHRNGQEIHGILLDYDTPVASFAKALFAKGLDIFAPARRSSQKRANAASGVTDVQR